MADQHGGAQAEISALRTRVAELERDVRKRMVRQALWKLRAQGWKEAALTPVTAAHAREWRCQNLPAPVELR